MIVSNTKNSSLFYQLTPTKQKSTFKCPECNKTFVSYYGLFQHFESHPTRNLRLNPPKFLQHQSSITTTSSSSDSYQNNDSSSALANDSPYAQSSFIPSQHQQAQPHLPKHKIGFADLSFIDFSCINFPRIAQYNCELYPRKIIQTTNQTLTLTSHTCELCKCSFPCEASLKLHQFKNYETNRQCKLYMGYNQQYECVQKTLDDIISTIEDKYETNLNNNNKANFLFKFGLIKRDYVDEYVLNMKLKEKLRLKYLLNDYNKQYMINLDKWKQMHMMQLNNNSSTATTTTMTSSQSLNCLNLNSNTLTTNNSNSNTNTTSPSNYEALIDQQSFKIYLKPNVNHSRSLLIRLKKFKKSKFNGVNGVLGGNNGAGGGGGGGLQQTNAFIYSNHAHIADILALNYSRILSAAATTTSTNQVQLTNIINGNNTTTNNGGKKRKSQQSVTPTTQPDLIDTTSSSSIGVVKKKFKNNNNDENIKEEKQQHHHHKSHHHKRSLSSTSTASNIASTIASVSSLKKPPPLHKPVKTTESVVVSSGCGGGGSNSEMPKLQPISALKQQSQQSSPDKPTTTTIKLPKLTPTNQTRKSLPPKLTIKTEPQNTKQDQEQDQEQQQQQSENNNNSTTNNENKTFKCKYCPSKFRSDSDFIKHVLTSHSKMLKERLNRQESSSKSTKKLNKTINTTTTTTPEEQPSINSEPQQQQELTTNNEINNITVA